MGSSWSSAFLAGTLPMKASIPSRRRASVAGAALPEDGAPEAAAPASSAHSWR